MSALDDLSPIAAHALWVSCMIANVPVQIEDASTIEHVASLVRSPVARARRGDEKTDD